MPDQLTDRARRAAEEIYAWPGYWPQDRDCRIIADEERLLAYAAIIERHMRGWIEDIRGNAIERNKEIRNTLDRITKEAFKEVAPCPEK